MDDWSSRCTGARDGRPHWGLTCDKDSIGWHSQVGSASSILSTHPKRVQTIRGRSPGGPGGLDWFVVRQRIAASWPRVRAVANWVNLSTPLGLLLARLGRADLRRTPGGLWVAERHGLRFPDAGAFTVGNVVLVKNRSLAELEALFPDVLEHEAGHASQWACCLGLPFLPLYLLANAYSWARTGTVHSANFFEVRADLAKGGYQRSPARPLWRRVSGR